MVDSPSQTANTDPQRINTNKERELGTWAEKFGTSRGQVKDAVGAVGTDPAAVKAYLAEAKPTNSFRSQVARGFYRMSRVPRRNQSDYSELVRESTGRAMGSFRKP